MKRDELKKAFREYSNVRTILDEFELQARTVLQNCVNTVMSSLRNDLVALTTDLGILRTKLVKDLDAKRQAFIIELDKIADLPDDVQTVKLERPIVPTRAVAPEVPEAPEKLPESE